VVFGTVLEHEVNDDGCSQELWGDATSSYWGHAQVVSRRLICNIFDITTALNGNSFNFFTTLGYLHLSKGDSNSPYLKGVSQKTQSMRSLQKLPLMLPIISGSFANSRLIFKHPCVNDCIAYDQPINSNNFVILFFTMAQRRRLILMEPDIMLCILICVKEQGKRDDLFDPPDRENETKRVK
jgi:hypothetical protein